MIRGLALLAMTGWGPVLLGQALAPAFDVASVRPNDSGSGSSSTQRLPNGQFIATNVTLRSLIVCAYGVRSFQVTGPSLIESRFDVNAKSPEGVSQDQTPAMLRSLLEERFKLKMRRETREQPIYALVMARDDRSVGPQMTVSKLICSGPSAPIAQPGQPGPCGLNTSVTNRTGRITGGAQSLDDIAAAIGNYATDRMVVNRTGLDGLFDYELRWTVDTPGPLTTTGNEPPTLVTAIQEQLGLRMESARGPVEFLVVESVSEPLPD